MSLVALALRTIVVQALLNRTYAGERVYDSSFDPLQVKISDARTPLIFVYGDGGVEAVMSQEPASEMSFKHELVIEAAVANRVLDGEVDGGTVEIQATDANSEMAIDLMQRQIRRALYASDSVWSDLYKTLVVSTDKIVARRGGGGPHSVRFAASQSVYTLSCLSEPDFSGDISYFWDRFLSALRDDESLADRASLVEFALTNDPLFAWADAAARLGLSIDAASCIGFAAPLSAMGLHEDIPLMEKAGFDGVDYVSDDVANNVPEDDA
jgi:hypothetical protein